MRDIIQLALVLAMLSYFVISGMIYNKKMNEKSKKDREEFKKTMRGG